jgi:hypothetical protein
LLISIWRQPPNIVTLCNGNERRYCSTR